MSKQIEAERIAAGDLTEDEILYLAQRDQLPDHVRNSYENQQELLRRLSASAPSLDDVAHTGDVNARSVTLTVADLERMGVRIARDDLNPPEQFEGARLGQRSDGVEPQPQNATNAREEEIQRRVRANAESSSDEEEEEEGEEVPYSEWRNQDLRSELARRGLSVDGKKDELIARLEEDDSSSEEEEGE